MFHIMIIAKDHSKLNFFLIKIQCDIIQNWNSNNKFCIPVNVSPWNLMNILQLETKEKSITARHSARHRYFIGWLSPTWRELIFQSAEMTS